MSTDRDPTGEPRSESNSVTRRELLTVLGLSAASVAFGAGLPGVLWADTRHTLRSSVPDLGRDGQATPPRLMEFELADVRLLDGPFLRAQHRDARYLLELEPDRMLHNFRVNAALAPKAPIYGGWESDEPWVDIRCHGHTLGHYLTAVSLMYAATSDVRFKARVDYIVGELKACQDAATTGLVCAFPDGSAQLDNAVAGRDFIGVPWYTMHKIFAGLRDAHRHAGSTDAVVVLRRLADWTWTVTHSMSDEQMQRMLQREHGGMNEVLADVSVIANEPKYLELARRFSHKALLTPLAERRDTLDGMHSNTQIPKVLGFQRLYELTGKPEYGTAAEFFWRTVTERRSFVTGGHGDGEHFFPPTEFAKHLGSAKTMETCCTHNMLRLTRALFTGTPSTAYADYYERALYNGILASQDPESGMMTYFQATRPGYVKLYHTPVESFWCCTGTGMENHAKYGDSIYFRGPDALYVNLFIPSVVRWKERGLTITQTTRFPDDDRSRLSVRAERPVRASLLVRHPSWCRAVTVTVNGRRWHTSTTPGVYVAIDRRWRSGDVVELHLPMTVRTEPLSGVPGTGALLYGPLVLAGSLGREGITRGADIIRNERESGNMLNTPVHVPVLTGPLEALVKRVERVPGTTLAFRTVGVGRPHDVSLVPYYQIAHERYTLYWTTTESSGTRAN